MIDISADDLGQFERCWARSIFYDHSANCRNPTKGPRLDHLPGKAPSARVLYPAHLPDSSFLARSQCKQPSTIERISSLPDYNHIIGGLERDFTSRWVSHYRSRKNFHRLTSLFVIKEAFEGHGMDFWTDDLDCDETKWYFKGDRHLKRSLSARTVFSLRLISVGSEVPFAQTPFSQSYRGIYDRDYRQRARTHLRYRDGPRRPDVSLVARSRLQSTSVIAECPVEMASWPFRQPCDFFRVYDEELWNSMTTQERIDACESVSRDRVDKRVHNEARRRWSQSGETPEGSFQSVKPEEAERVVYEAGLPHLRQAGRKAFAAVVAHSLNLFEMCGSVYGCIVIDRRFARMYVLSSGRIAVEFSTAGELVDSGTPVQGRGGSPYSRIMHMDLHAALPSRFTGDELSPGQPRTFWFDKLGDQVTSCDVEDEEDATPSEKFDRCQTSADLGCIQTYIDFMAAGVVRSGAVNAHVPISEKLPAPVQDSLDADILACIVQKGLPMESAIKIREEARRPYNSSAYLDFSAEEQQGRPESKGLWRRLVKHWRDGHDPRWDYYPENTSSEGGASTAGEDQSDGSEAASDFDRNMTPSGDAGDNVDDVVDERGGGALEADRTGSEADDEIESDREESDDGSSDSRSLYSERTRQWSLETGSDADNTVAHETDWRTFDPWDDTDGDVLGYSSWSAENDWFEANQNSENDTCFVLSIAERVSQESCHIVPVTKEEMDELVQTQYALDLERYK